MAQQKPPLPSFSSPITYMTTVSPEIVGREITASPILLEKTRLVLIADEGETVTMSVFRVSSASLGTLSRDIFVRKGNGWEFKEKDPEKYLTPPDPPSGAIEAEINGVKCWTMHPLTDEDKRWLGDLISQTPFQGRETSL